MAPERGDPDEGEDPYERKDPYLDYRFTVEVDSLVFAGFTEVTGIEREVETEEVEEGGVNGFTHHLPTGYTNSNLTLSRGLTDATELWDWLQLSGDEPVDRRNCRILLQDTMGAETWGWEVHDAYPVRWEGPDLEADGGAVAMETLELNHRGITRIDGRP
ncbi:phage tail protein [Natrialbaceae archaeon AArc-T1-2]|uniref:phage tail protein n=1 Tax=Natrialbaceae archaeon AArc-T1-2 TaxID=3053904 RepID=UPI00255AFA68|nr:phage tail protein [Natrialbaceae archaeon AArc-T1-2]WIV66064.1 phage tail protein [Natrialbaceae archaeon AArc-T1-2]